MSRIEKSVLIQAPPEKVFRFHDEPKNLLRVLPPYLRVEILEAPPRLQRGARLKYVIYVGPLRFDWQLEIREHDPPRRFVDTQLEGPFLEYEHTHLFEAEKDGTRLTSIIEYRLPPGPFTELAHRILFEDRVAEVLEQGNLATRKLLEEAER